MIAQLLHNMLTQHTRKSADFSGGSNFLSPPSFSPSSSHWLLTVTTTTARWCSCLHYYQLCSRPEHSPKADSLGGTAWSHLCTSVYRESVSYSSSQLPITRSIPTRLLAPGTSSCVSWLTYCLAVLGTHSVVDGAHIALRPFHAL